MLYNSVELNRKRPVVADGKTNQGPHRIIGLDGGLLLGPHVTTKKGKRGLCFPRGTIGDISHSRRSVS